MKSYVIIFKRLRTGNYRPFQDDLAASPRINRWWHYLSTCYIIITDLSANELSHLVTDLLKKHSLPVTHLVLEVNLRNRQGMLPKDAWQWMRNNVT